MKSRLRSMELVSYKLNVQCFFYAFQKCSASIYLAVTNSGPDEMVQLNVGSYLKILSKLLCPLRYRTYFIE